MNFAPYKFFGVRGFGVAYISSRAASLAHHRIFGTPADNRSLGSPAPGHYAAIREIVNYVAGLGAKIAPAGADRRRLFEAGMSRIASHERALLGLALEGSARLRACGTSRACGCLWTALPYVRGILSSALNLNA